jgi:uncharacterized protein YgbK (DUF1537 family)
MPTSLLLGAIADDYTGAADLAGMLRSRGVRTALCLHPDAVSTLEGCRYQAVVVALKTRSIPADDACRQSLEALEKLRSYGARQIYFKYCSTFDSSPRGNIGPVLEALMEALNIPFTVAVPALPVNGRTQYFGYLFVGGLLLSESHMREHPIHPMTEANLVRHLQAQTRLPVGLIPHPVVRAGAPAIRQRIRRLTAEGTAVALVDALTDEDLRHIAEAIREFGFVTGGSGLGGALAEVWQREGMLDEKGQEAALHAAAPGEKGGTLILSGSCSAATLAQLAAFEKTFGGGVRLRVLELFDNAPEEVERVYETLRQSLTEHGWGLVYSSADADARRQIVSAALERGFTHEALSLAIEAAHRKLASHAVREGLARHLIVAGGETSGAVAEALDLDALEVEDVLDPGVPVLRAIHAADVTVTFKSGNFGSPDFFSKALLRLGLHPTTMT